MPAKNRRLATVAIVGGTFGSVLGSTVINVPLRDIATDLKVSIATSTLLVTLAGVTFATLLPLGGWIGNRYGRRNVFCIAAALLALAGLIAMFSQSFAVIVAMRVIQGAVSAAIVPVVMTILADLYEPERRAVGLSAWATANSLGQAMGPPLGGILATAISWRAAFAPAAIVSALACIAALRFVPNDPPTRISLEWRGAVGLTTGAGLLLTAFTAIPQVGIGSPSLWAIAIAGLLALWFFQRSIATAPEPFVSPRVFREPSYVQSVFGIVGAGIALGSTLLAIPLYLTHSLHYTTLITGFVVLALPLAMVVMAPFTSGSVKRFGSAPVTYASLVSLTAGCGALWPIVAHRWSVAGLILCLLVVGTAIAFAYTATAVGSTSAESGRYGAAIGLFNLLRIGGSAVGAALVAIVLQADPSGYDIVFVCTSLILMAALGLSLRISVAAGSRAAYRM